MALNELLIISIQTRLKGSLLIGHCKQEPLVVLHNCPWARLRPLLQGGGGCSGAACALRGLQCPSMWSACLELCMHVWDCTSPSGVLCSCSRLCVPIWGCGCIYRVCVCIYGVVHVCLGLCTHVWGSAHLVLCMPNWDLYVPL